MAQLKLTRQALCLLFVMTLVACTATVAPVPTGTPEDAAAICIQSITTARKAATALLRADKITIDKDKAIQASLDAAVPGCRELAKQGVLQP